MVTHGDFSLDNVFVEDGRVTGCKLQFHLCVDELPQSQAEAHQQRSDSLPTQDGGGLTFAFYWHPLHAAPSDEHTMKREALLIKRDRLVAPVGDAVTFAAQRS